MKEGMIDVTGVDLVELAKAAYDLSRPQGLGFLHFTPDPLTDEEAQSLLRDADSHLALSLDYVHGRAVKLTVYRDGDTLSMRDRWYDHSQSQLQELLERIGKTASSQTSLSA